MKEISFLTYLYSFNSVGYSAYGISYAGHGSGVNIVGPESWETSDYSPSEREKMQNIAWTIDGQVLHKISWIDTHIIPKHKGDYSSTKKVKNNFNFIFIGHSIGCHLIQRLCILRPDILRITKHILFLMPFIIFDPPLYYSQKVVLNTGARTQNIAFFVLDLIIRFAKCIPPKALEFYLKNGAGVEDEEGLLIARSLITSRAMARNFLRLGMEELRDVPQSLDEPGIRHLLRGGSGTSEVKHDSTKLAFLYCGGLNENQDQWCDATSHIRSVEDFIKREAQRNGSFSMIVKNNISYQHLETLQHDFVVHPEMVPPVINFCTENIQKNTQYIPSRL